MKIVLTGAAGFVGRRLFDVLFQMDDIYVLPVIRNHDDLLFFPEPAIREVDENSDWSTIVENSQIVIHLAALAHNKGIPSAEEYERVNVKGALKLAREAAALGVKRFVFISSIGVNGKNNTSPFTANDKANPAEAYALSKWKAEQGLWEVQKETGMELVIIRPPLVYGPGAPGNFGSLVRWVDKGVPLPLGAIHNKRSLVGIDNLVDLIVTCIDHPAAANQVFLAGDGEDLSTTELLRGVGRAMGKPARLIPVPAGLLQFGATLLGKKAMAQRLLDSLQVDISKTCEVLGWQPPYTVDEGLRRCFEQSN